MKAVVIAFFATNALLLAGTAVFGAMVSAEHYFIEHFALGLATTLFACLCHCVVFTYFMATGKMIVLAVEDASLDPELALEASRLKMRAFSHDHAGDSPGAGGSHFGRLDLVQPDPGDVAPDGCAGFVSDAADDVMGRVRCRDWKTPA